MSKVLEPQGTAARKQKVDSSNPKPIPESDQETDDNKWCAKQMAATHN